MPVWTAAFITGLRERVTTALAGLDTALVNGTAGGVAITIRRGEPWISVPKLTALPEPGNLAAVMLALHLLQPALVHVNTRLVQTVLDTPAFHDRMDADERRGLSSLFWTHITAGSGST